MKQLCLAAILAVAATACGDSGIPMSQIEAKIHAAFCTYAVTCQYYPDNATCLAATLTKTNALESDIAAVNAKLMSYDANSAQSCVNEIAAQSCGFTGLYPKNSDPCNKMFQGKVATAGACAQDLECTTGNFCQMPTGSTCDPTKMCCTGTCAAKAVAGASCMTAPCADGFYCSSVSTTCKPIVTTSGGACEDFSGCADPMICNYDFTTMMFTTCATPAARMATCKPTDLIPCADSRDYCDTGTTKCTPNVAVGTACNGTNGASCVGYATCDATTNKCVALASAGQSCTVNTMTMTSNCLGDLACNGSCALPTTAPLACK